MLYLIQCTSRLNSTLRKSLLAPNFVQVMARPTKKPKRTGRLSSGPDLSTSTIYTTNKSAKPKNAAYKPLLQQPPFESSAIRAKIKTAKVKDEDASADDISVPVGPKELTLEYTLPIGQSFRWKSIDPEHDRAYVGVLGDSVLCLRHNDDTNDVEYKVLGGSEDVEGRLVEYFMLDRVHLSELDALWASKDTLYESVRGYVSGARMLRQDPVETLFSFICSQNNHISRIGGMVNKLAGMYGRRIDVDGEAEEIKTYRELYGKDSKGAPLDTTFYAFPSLLDLSENANEEDLRAAGFGYRARYIEESAKQIVEELGGEPWLYALRDTSYEKAVEELQVLSGVGNKVASCVALFSLDKPDAVPVDVHVWNIAVQHYTPQLRGKTNGPKYHPVVQEAFKRVFGDLCGWAHQALFVYDLSSVQKKLASRGLLDDEPSGSDGESDWSS
jgi:N-glycosylase/DNA lyase